MAETPPGCPSQNARTHGCTSRNLPLALQGEAEELCEVFLTGAPEVPEVRTAARHVADLVLLLKTIQHAIHAEMDRIAEASTLDTEYQQWFQDYPISVGLARVMSADSELPPPGFEALLPTLAEHAEWRNRLTAEQAEPDVERRIARHSEAWLQPSRTLLSLKTYDRKARSRLSKAIQRLDYLKIEALRHQS